MTDREKLGNLLRSGCKELEKIPGCKTWEDMADHLIANGVTVQRWIPVTERLPKQFEDVLAFDEIDEEPFMAWISTGGRWYVPGYEEECFDFSHWMPLPEPPKEEA